jgi:hypothetical protein
MTDTAALKAAIDAAPDIWDLLSLEQTRDACKAAVDPTAALAALSEAAVAYGRSVATGHTHGVECDRCKGSGITEWYADGNSCEDCRGRKTVARPGLPPLPATG